MKDDELLRSAIQSAEGARDQFLRLGAQSANDLFAVLAQRTQAMTRATPTLSAFDAPFDIDDLLRDDATVGLGRRIFRRWSRALHQFACGPNKEDEDIRTKLLSAVTGKEGGAAVIAALLVATFGASPAIAAVVAALLVKILVAPAADEICQTWGKSLGELGEARSEPR